MVRVDLELELFASSFVSNSRLTLYESAVIGAEISIALKPSLVASLTSIPGLSTTIYLKHYIHRLIFVS